MTQLRSAAPIADKTEIQVAEYVCGLLGPTEHAQVHMLLSRDDNALAAALIWEERLLALVDALPRVQPEPALRERLQRTLDIGPPPASMPPPQPQLLRQRSVEPAAVTSSAGGHVAVAKERPLAAAPLPSPTEAPAKPRPISHREPPPRKARSSNEQVFSSRSSSEPSINAHWPSEPEVGSPSVDDPVVKDSPPSQPPIAAGRTRDEKAYRVLVRKLWFWRLIGLCATSAAIFGFFMPGEPPPPPVQIVKVAPTRAAILQAPGMTSTPGWTATLGPQGNLSMRPLVKTEVPVGSQVLLWTRSETIPEPRLLGRIDPNRPVQVPSAQLGPLADDQLLEITLERDEDAVKGVPNGPILFIGKMAVFGADMAADPPAGDGAATSSSAVSGTVTQERQP